MKQSEKSKLTQDKILKAAIEEFGTNSYDNASLNHICSDHQISKGLIYHNFENKDALYLNCVELCFKEITSFLAKEEYCSDDFQENISKLMYLRNEFFDENPFYRRLFFDAILLPPKHLEEKIKAIKADFDHFNLLQYQKILNLITLRDGISEKEALEYFHILLEMFNGYYGRKFYEASDFNSLVDEHEMQVSKFFNIILYGIVKERTNHDTIDS